MASEFGLDPNEQGIGADEKMLRRANQARVIDAWDTAGKRQEETDRVQAEQKANRMGVTISKSVHVNMRQRYESDYGLVPDKGWPCQALVEQRFQEVEEGEVKADSLNHVVSMEDVLEDAIGAVLDRDGAIRLKGPRSRWPCRPRVRT